MMGTVYALPIEPQREAIDQHCFGDCGKVSMGGMLWLNGVGACWVCPEEHCPHLKGQTDEPVGTSDWTGDLVRIRAVRHDVTEARP